MRYIIQFVDRTTMIVPQKEGEEVGRALVAGEAIILRGAYINPRFISIIKPIKRGWYSDEYVEQQERIELSAPDTVKMLSSPPQDA